MMKYSLRLENNVRESEKEINLKELVDMSSATGWNSDTECVQGAVEKGVELAISARKYDPNAVIFYAPSDEATYYQYGKDEDDMIRRYDEAVREETLDFLRKQIIKLRSELSETIKREQNVK